MAPENTAATKPCPFCGEQIMLAAKKCRFCGEYLDPSLRPKPPTDWVGVDAIVPLNITPIALIAGYLGAISLVPCIGLPFAVAAVIVGRVAIRKIKASPELKGLERAYFGFWAGIVMLVLTAGFMIVSCVVAMVNNMGHRYPGG